MKIVFLCRYFYPHIGGVEKHCLELGKELIKKGHSVTVITSRESFSQNTNYHSRLLSDRKTGDIDKIKIIYINNGKVNKLEKFKAWRELIKLKNVIKNADIIHCHDIFYWYLPFRLIYPKKKVFVTFHGYEGNLIPNKRSIFMHRLAEKLTNGNICVGNFYEKWYQTKPNYTIYGAVKKINSRDKSNLLSKAIFIGRLEKETGIMEYLNAIKILKAKKITMALDVYGDGSLRKISETFAKKNRLKIQFKGFVPNADEQIKNYNFVFTSRYLGILESLASRRIVFALYNNKIKKDYLVNTPFKNFILIFKNAEELSKGIIDVMNNGYKYKNMIDYGYKWVKNKTWKDIANTYLDLWKKTW